MSKRPSETDPIRLVSVLPGASFGRIGITFCPGKKNPAGGFEHWHRDLAIDLDAIAPGLLFVNQNQI